MYTELDIDIDIGESQRPDPATAYVNGMPGVWEHEMPSQIYDYTPIYETIPSVIDIPMTHSLHSAYSYLTHDAFDRMFRAVMGGDVIVITPRAIDPFQEQERQSNPSATKKLHVSMFNDEESAIAKGFDTSKELPECAITLTTLTHWSQVAVAVPCGHLFDRDALIQWSKVSHTCPQCRAIFRLGVRQTPLYKAVSMGSVRDPPKIGLLLLCDR